MKHPFFICCCLLYFALTLALDDANSARILYQTFENTGLGPYNFSFETSDGTKREEQGHLTNENTEDESLIVHGSYSYTDGTGQVYLVKYTADDNGFHPEGDHIKVPPFVPWVHRHNNQDSNQAEVQNPPVQYLPSTPAPYPPSTPAPYPPSSTPKPSLAYVPSTPKPPKKYFPVKTTPETQYITTSLKPPNRYTPPTTPVPLQQEEEEVINIEHQSTPQPLRVELFSRVSEAEPSPSPPTVQIQSTTFPPTPQPQPVIVPSPAVNLRPLPEQRLLVQNQIYSQPNRILVNPSLPTLRQIQQTANVQTPQVIQQQNPILAALLANGFFGANNIPTPRPFLMPVQLISQTNIGSSTLQPIQVPQQIVSSTAVPIQANGIVSSTPLPILGNLEQQQRVILEAQNNNQNIISSTASPLEFVSATPVPIQLNDGTQIILQGNLASNSVKTQRRGGGRKTSAAAANNVIDLEQFDPASRKRLYALLASGADINEINNLMK